MGKKGQLKYRGNIYYFTVACAILPVQICTRYLHAQNLYMSAACWSHYTHVNMGLKASTIHLSIDFANFGRSFILQCVRTPVTVACNDGIIPQKWIETPPIPRWRDWYLHFVGEGHVGGRIGRGAHGQGVMGVKNILITCWDRNNLIFFVLIPT